MFTKLRKIFKNRSLQLLVLILAPAVFLQACAGETATPAEPSAGQDHQGVFRVAMQPIVQTDPAFISSDPEIIVASSIYDYLVDVTPQNTIAPRLARQWTVSEDGMTYTFTIRTDIPWVKHNPVTLETTQEVDEEGNPRFVTAHDFVYGIKRACDPNTGSYYSSIIAPNIVGCEDVLYAEDPDDIPAELVDAIGVSAPDDATLIVELPFAAAETPLDPGDVAAGGLLDQVRREVRE